MIFKKIIKTVLIVIILFGGTTLALDRNEDNFPYQGINENTQNPNEAIKDTLPIIEKVARSVKMDYYIENEGSGLNYIKNIINYFLGIVGTIATIIVIYGFYLILNPVGKSEDSIQKAKKYVGYAFLAIAIIGLSWMLTSWIFYVYEKAITN